MKKISTSTRILTTYQIETVFGSVKYYETFTKGNYACITLPKNRLSAASYTHELLHIYLRTKGALIGNSIINQLRAKPLLSGILSDLALEEMTNSIDHIKMLPIYLRLGYPLDEFIDDFHTSQFSWIDLGFILHHFKKRNWFTTTMYEKKGIEQYVCKFFVASAAPNSKFDYSIQLRTLKKLDLQLYSILNHFLDEWKKYDYEDPDEMARIYYFFSAPFVESLDAWVRSKKIKQPE